MEITFRPLQADEIDVRVSTVSDKGVSLLLYKDARADMIILDETVGAANWQRRHTRDNANCIVSIWDKEKEQWIEKEDTGTESFTEKKKGLASDSFKRACTNWGIGRELYTAPFIWVAADKIEWTNRNGKQVPKTRFSVNRIEYDSRGRIIELVIISNKNTVVYSYPCNVPPPYNEDPLETLNKLIMKYNKFSSKPIPIDNLCARYGVKTINELSAENVQSAINGMQEALSKLART